MSIGICTRYSRHEATFAAIRIAEWARRSGRELSIFSITDQRISIDPRWDREVVHDQLFTQWVEGCDTIVWTTIPHPEQVYWARRQGKRCVAVVLWHELILEDRESMTLFDQLICPSIACYQLLRGWGLRNLMCAPWDCGSPFFSKPAEHPVIKPRLLLPLWDGNARRTEMTAIDIIGRALYRDSQVEATIVYNSSTIRAAGVKKLKDLQKWFQPRLVIRKGVHPTERPLLFQEHDLTLWPSHWESLGLTGLTSIAMGTPVMGFNFRPTNEILSESNGVPVRCSGERVNDLGLPCAIPDYEMMDELLHQAVKDPAYIRQLQTTVLDGAEQRRAGFERQLDRVFI